MKKKSKILAVIASIIGLTLAMPGSMHAQVAKLTISGMIYEQGTPTATGAKAPVSKPFPTAAFLKLAQTDAGATAGSLCWNGSGFEVDTFTSTNTVNESDPASDFTITDSEATILTNGTASANGSFSLTTNEVITLTYDDSGSGGSTTFTVTGFAKMGGSATAANLVTGSYTGGISFSFTAGVGSGTFNGISCIITGFTMTGSGKAKLNNGQGTGGGS